MERIFNLWRKVYPIKQKCSAGCHDYMAKKDRTCQTLECEWEKMEGERVELHTESIGIILFIRCVFMI